MRYVQNFKKECLSIIERFITIVAFGTEGDRRKTTKLTGRLYELNEFKI